MDYFDPTGARIIVRYEGTAPDDGHDYRVERDNVLQGHITGYPSGTWHAATATGRTATGFTTPRAATHALLEERDLV